MPSPIGDGPRAPVRPARRVSTGPSAAVLARRAQTPALAMALTAGLALAGCSVAVTTAAPATAPPSTSAAAPAPGPSEPPVTPSAAEPPRADATGAAGTALAGLAGLAVKGRAPMTGYSREQFGPAWTDVDRNGCDTRNDVLARDLTATSVRPGTRGCVVLSGTLDDPYSGKALSFTRGEGTSGQVQVDHVVALGDAWQKGAQGLDAPVRTALANDPLNLLAVDGPVNAAKGDGDAATWLPPNAAARCGYVARQVAVKARYGLWVAPAEHDAIARVLGACPDEPLPTGGLAPPATTTAPATDTPTTDSPTTDPHATDAPGPDAPVPHEASPTYATCTQVRSAGAAPIHPGDPGFEARFDRDGDGVGCDG